MRYNSAETSSLNINKRCCDPWNKHKKNVCNNLKDISDFKARWPELHIAGDRACKRCWTQLRAPKPQHIPSENSVSVASALSAVSASPATTDAEDSCQRLISLTTLNQHYRQAIGSPIRNSAIINPQYATSKLKREQQNLKRKFEDAGLHIEEEENTKSDTDSEIVQLLKDKVISHNLLYIVVFLIILYVQF